MDKSLKVVCKDADGYRLEFDPDISEEERRFYMKVYPKVNMVKDRKVHCTVCNMHIGTAPAQESIIRMHPVLRVTHCKKCHDFYNSGEFSKGEDGSELYCRWCGQGGEVYCCSKCPYVFCKSCIVGNLSKGCVNDIEENENWNCFVCAPKIMWHLRAQHWALMHYIEKQKKAFLNADFSDNEIKRVLTRDRTKCCRTVTKVKSGNLSDSSCDSDMSSLSKKRRHSEKKMRKLLPKPDNSFSDDGSPTIKKQKKNDEVVCTPDVLSMLHPEPDEPETETQKPEPQRPTPTIVPQIQSVSVQIPAQIRAQPAVPTVLNAQATQTQTQTQTQQQHPPPLIIRNFQPQFRAITPTVVTRKTIVGPRPPSATPSHTPVYHTINGFRIDLNSAAQQETFRLPNGKLIQVKKQGTAAVPLNSAVTQANVITSTAGTVTLNNHVVRAQIQPRQIQPTTHAVVTQTPGQTIQHLHITPPGLATIRYAAANTSALPGNTTITTTIPQAQQATGTAVHVLNGTPQVQHLTSRPTPIPTLVRQFFSATPLGQARSQLQNQIFSSMDICQHLTGKIHTLTNSNAYKSVRNYTDVKELYIHLSYLFTYAIGRFKGLQDKCLEDMRRLGFAGDAASLASGQLEKYASDGDDDEIEIVEPKTTCIDLDSDNEESAAPSTANKKPLMLAATAPAEKTTLIIKDVKVVDKAERPVIENRPKPQIVQVTTIPTTTTSSFSKSPQTPSQQSEVVEGLEVAANLLAGMLEIELHEGNGQLRTTDNGPKKPRKKTTNKPNPHLIKQQQMQERERMNEMIRRDSKLKTQCSIVLDRVEDVMPSAKPLLEAVIAAHQLEELWPNSRKLSVSSANSAEETCDLAEKLTNLVENDAEDKLTTVANPEEKEDSTKLSSSLSSEEKVEENVNKATDDDSEEVSVLTIVETIDEDMTESQETTENVEEVSKTIDENTDKSNEEKIKESNGGSEMDEKLEKDDSVEKMETDDTENNKEKDGEENNKNSPGVSPLSSSSSPSSSSSSSSASISEVNDDKSVEPSSIDNKEDENDTEMAAVEPDTTEIAESPMNDSLLEPITTMSEEKLKELEEIRKSPHCSPVTIENGAEILENGNDLLTEMEE